MTVPIVEVVAATCGWVVWPWAPVRPRNTNHATDRIRNISCLVFLPVQMNVLFYISVKDYPWFGFTPCTTVKARMKIFRSKHLTYVRSPWFYCWSAMLGSVSQHIYGGTVTSNPIVSLCAEMTRLIKIFESQWPTVHVRPAGQWLSEIKVFFIYNFCHWIYMLTS